MSLTAPNGATYNYMFANTRFANVVLNTTGMPTGVYNVYVVLQDSQGAKTSATVGSFQIEHAAEAKPVANEFLVEELGLGIISLVVLVVIALLVWKRVTHTATPASLPAS